MVQRAWEARDVVEVLNDIARDARRAGQVIERMRRMLRGESKRFEPLNVNHIIDEALALCNGELIARKIEVVRDFQTTVPPLSGDPIGLQHVLLNLIVNAYESMAEVPINSRTLRIATASNPAGSVTITVTDTGTGFDPAAQEKLFEPLYTTKKAGLGLGLSICRSVVKAHDGDISISVVPNGGTNVTITLPVGRLSRD
jgi:signal transduction histidine kinase